KVKRLIVAMTSAGRLCGAFHNNIGRQIKALVPEFPAGTEFKLIRIGDISRAILGRIYPVEMLMHFVNIEKVPAFGDDKAIANEIVNLDYEFDHAELYFNIFKSVISYNTTTVPIFSQKTIKEAEKFNL
ncbi:hypothetical protein CAPTEDRAFT_95270, partial [Capitella teleta]